MADSAPISLPRGEWVEVVEGPLTDCLVTPNRTCFYLYAVAEPDAEFGHMVKEFENFNAVPEDGSSMWMMSPNGDAEAWVSERTFEA
jgi:hypothetical protein